MAAISFPTAADTPSRTTYTSSPWTDPSGNQWLWSAAKERWSPISETVENAVTDNNTNAVSSNAVFDALALKAPLSGATFTGPITATAITGTTGTFSGNISPTLTNTQSFGSTGLNWNTIWTRNVRSDSGTLILNDGNAAITITSGTLALGNRKLTALRGLEFQTDNTYDIGATSTTLRPRDLFLARNAGIGGNLTATGTVTAGGTNTWNGSTFSGAQAFSGDVSVTDATASTTTTTGALKVAGGLGVVGAVNAGARVTATRGTVGVGTVYTNLSLTDIAGTSTDFLSRFVVGDSITFNTTVGGVTGPETKVITAIASDTSMTTLPFSGASASGAESYTHTTASAVMNPSGAITGTRGTFSGPVSVSGLTITGTPLPIESGGTGGSGPSTLGAFRTELGLNTDQSVTFAGVTTSASTYADGATFTYTNAAAITNHRNALGLGTGSAVVFGNITSNQIQIGVEARTIGTTSGSGLIVRTTGGPAGEFSYGGCYLRSPFRIRNGSDLESRLETDDSNRLAQRNGTAAQAFRLYDTFASASDYHRLAIATARATATAMSGATITLANIIPAGAVVVGITCKVTTVITGATSFDLGTAADADRFGAGIAVAVGTTSDNRNWTSGTVECFPSNTSLILTANGGNFATGAVYVSVQYLSGQSD